MGYKWAGLKVVAEISRLVGQGMAEKINRPIDSSHL